MPMTQLSYYICDFIQDVSGRLYVLEFGDAWYNSGFEGRLEQAGVDTRYNLIPAHLAKIGGRISFDSPALRNLKEGRRRQRYYLEGNSVDSLPEAPKDPTQPNIIIINAPNPAHDDVNAKQLIQELTAKNRQKLQDKKTTPSNIILNGSNDMLWTIVRDKKILHTFLSLNDLRQFQPRTWHHECKQGSVFTVPEDIAHFIIKQSNGTLGEGTLVVPREDLAVVLEVMADQDATRFSLEQTNLYGKGVAHYKEQSNKNILIQEVCFSQTKTAQCETGNTEYHAAGRGVFAVIEENETQRIEMIDLYWNLASQPAMPDNISAESIISTNETTADFNSYPSLSLDEKQKIEPELIAMLTSILQTTNKMDIRSYLLTLAQQQRNNEIKYFMENYSHIRVNYLDHELIETLEQIEPLLSKTYLLEQAEYYLLPHHVQHLQDGALLEWLLAEVEDANCSFKATLEKFIAQEFANLAELGFKKENSAWFKTINLIKQKMNAPKAGVAAQLPFFNGSAGQVGTKLDTTTSFTPQAAGCAP
ncbi:MAG: hypothetical protein V4501_08395 [Pseudomonadota bacterium]